MADRFAEFISIDTGVTEKWGLIQVCHRSFVTRVFES